MPDAPQAHRGVIDTSVVIDLEQLEAAQLPLELAVSAITMAELAAGPHATVDAEERARRQDRLQRAEAAFDPLPFDGEAARAYGRIYAAQFGVRAQGARHPGSRSLDCGDGLCRGSADLHPQPGRFPTSPGACQCSRRLTGRLIAERFEWTRFVEVSGLEPPPSTLRTELRRLPDLGVRVDSQATFVGEVHRRARRCTVGQQLSPVESRQQVPGKWARLPLARCDDWLSPPTNSHSTDESDDMRQRD